MRTGIDRARRNVVVLVAAQALLGAQLPMVIIVAGLAGQSLSPNPCLATLPISIMVAGSMLAAQPIAALMQRHGRRVGFWTGTLAGAVGGGLGVAGLVAQSFVLFLAGSLATGAFMASYLFYRFAAADTATEAFRPKAISYVMAGGLVSALLGPQLVKLTSEAYVVPFLGTYLAVIAVNAVGSLLFFGLDIPRPDPPAADSPAGRSKRELLATPGIAVAVICAMVSYALMNLVMTSAPLAVVGCGFTQGHAADIVSAHVLAMYAPAFFTGHLIARFGAERIVALGLILLGGAGLIGLAGVDLVNFFGAMVLLGIGWNFGFIGATSMLASMHRPEERGRIQGLNDALVFGCVTLASFASGGLMNCAGGTPEEGWQAVNVAMIPFLTLAGAALIWLALRPGGAGRVRRAP
jgi:MFS family permease